MALEIAELSGLSPQLLRALDAHRRDVILLGASSLRRLRPVLGLTSAEQQAVDVALWFTDTWAIRELRPAELAEAHAFRWRPTGEQQTGSQHSVWDTWVFTMLEAVTQPRCSQAAIRATVRLVLDGYLDHTYGSRTTPAGEPLILVDPTTRAAMEQLLSVLNDEVGPNTFTPDDVTERSRPVALQADAPWRSARHPEPRVETWRQVFAAIHDLESGASRPDAVDSVLLKHLECGDLLHELTWAAAAPDYLTPAGEIDPLYGLTRVVDLCIAGRLLAGPNADAIRARMADARMRPFPTGPDTIGHLLDWLGATRIDEPAYHPFFHEVVSVATDPDPQHPVEIVDEVWPGMLLGSLVLQRAGVRVRAGAQVMNTLAASSPLYFCWWRPSRQTVDASHGWGHNSQWATDFRRDVLTPAEFRYNSNGDGLPDAGYRTWPHLWTPEHSQLLRYRHATTALIDDADTVMSAGPHRDPRTPAPAGGAKSTACGPGAA